MLKSTDLMIGNFVIQKHSGIILKVSKINPPYIEAEGEDGQFHEESIDPIQLDKEFFEKNKFYGIKTNEGIAYRIAPNLFVKDGICGTLSCCSNGGCVITPLFKCEFVHELQHIQKSAKSKKKIVL